MPKNFSYLRVSTLDQDLEKNKSDILMHLANEKNLVKVELVKGNVSGKFTSCNRKVGPILVENMGRMTWEMKVFLHENPIPEKFLKRRAPKI
jgi:hypothetical protein